jgi:hypothetical protein
MKSRIFTLTTIIFSLVFLISCGGGGGGGASSSSNTGGTTSTVQLSSSVPDLSSYKNTFADTTKVEGTLVSNTSLLEKLMYGFVRLNPFSNAYAADSLQTCNDNTKPVAISTGSSADSYKVIQMTGNADDKPCFTSSQEVGAYIAVQAKNLYQGDKQCDIAMIPKAGGKIFCLQLGIPADILAKAGKPNLRFNQAFAGIASLKSLGGKITQNGKYFFIAFNDDFSGSSGYDGVYRIDLSGAEPTGQLAYLKESPRPKTIGFDGYQQLENGDMIVTHADLAGAVGTRRFYTYYVGVAPTFPGVNSQQVVLINSAISYGYDEVNSPLFKWAKANLSVGGETITDGGSQNIIFSGSQSSSTKSFYIVASVNRYQTFAGQYFNSLLIKGVVSGNTISFEDYGPTSISFFGTAGISDDLSTIYWIKDWPGSSDRGNLITRRTQKLISTSDSNYNPDVEVVTNLSPIAGYSPTLVYETKNKVFISIVKSDFYDTAGLMNLKLYAIDKVSGGVSWINRANNFVEIPLTGFTGNGYRMTSVVPSLVADKLSFRITQLSNNSEYSLDVTSSGFNVVSLGTKGAIASTHAVVAGK